jgi:phospholipid/cholesterol/gamma-HCH transport system substrate-binding protein
MKNSRLEWKVGLFVVVSLVVMAALVLRFSKGATLFTKTYEIYLRTANVGGIIPGAVVLMAGVRIGYVEATDLQAGGKTVLIKLKILKKYPVYPDAIFSIKQAGFLGDRYVSIEPKQNKGEPLQADSVVDIEEPFDLQEVARSAVGLLQRVDDTAKKLNDAVTRIDKTLFAENTLTNLTVTVSNFRMLSDEATATLNGINQFVITNTHPLSASVSNLVVFSDQLKQASREVLLTISTNRQEVAAAIKNIESASMQVDKLVTDLQAGKGLAGSVLKDDELKRDFTETMHNLNLLSSNLNSYGLFYKPKVRRSTQSTAPPYTGRSPNR